MPTFVNSTITAGGTAQSGLAADESRAYVLVQNNSDEDMWIKFATTFAGSATAATDSGIRVPALGSFDETVERMPMIKNAMSIIGATTGKKYGIVTDTN